MPDSTGPVLAVPDKRAARLAHISLRQLHYWDQTGLIVPSIKRKISQRNTVRLYNFQDLLSLLVAAQLRNRVSLQHIRRVVEQLSERGFVEPLRELHFATHGQYVFFQYPDGSWSGDPNPDQVIFHQVVELDPCARSSPRSPNATRHRRGGWCGVAASWEANRSSQVRAFPWGPSSAISMRAATRKRSLRSTRR